jgi:hypothetical protein
MKGQILLKVGIITKWIMRVGSLKLFLSKTAGPEDLKFT